MPLVDVLAGVYDDLEAVLDAYDWEANCRVNDRGIRPSIVRDVDVIGKPLPDQSIIIQLALDHWIELAGTSVALRARINANMMCVGKTPEVCRALVDELQTIMFGASKSYASTTFTTIRKIIPSRCYTTFIQKQQSGGYYTQTLLLQAETQASNTN